MEFGAPSHEVYIEGESGLPYVWLKAVCWTIFFQVKVTLLPVFKSM